MLSARRSRVARLQGLRDLVGDRDSGLEHPLDRGGPREHRFGHHRREGEPVLAHRAEEILDLVGGVAERRAPDRVRRALERVRGPEHGRERLVVARTPSMASKAARVIASRCSVASGRKYSSTSPPSAKNRRRSATSGDTGVAAGAIIGGSDPGGDAGLPEEKNVGSRGLELPDAGRVLHADRADPVEDLLQEADEALEEGGGAGALLDERGGLPLEQPLDAGGKLPRRPETRGVRPSPSGRCAKTTSVARASSVGASTVASPCCSVVGVLFSGGRFAGAGADCPLSAMPVKAQYIVRVGMLAVALGVGAAVANTPAVAFAEPTDTSSSSGSSSLVGFEFVIRIRGKYVINGSDFVNKFVGLSGWLLVRFDVWDCAEFG